MKKTNNKTIRRLSFCSIMSIIILANLQDKWENDKFTFVLLFVIMVILLLITLFYGIKLYKERQ